MKRVNKWLIDNFGYSKKEINGSIVMLLIICFSFVALHGYDYFKYASNEDSREKDLQVLEKWKAELKWKEEQVEKFVEAGNKSKLGAFRKFDPNKVSEEELLEMNLSAYLASNWNKYLQKGGKFSKESDILKLYGMDQAIYDELKPYLAIEKSLRKVIEVKEADVGVIKKVDLPIEKIDINLATSEQLQLVRGIGPAYSQRIVKYRNALGGFYSKSQLREVYGLNSETVDALWQRFDLDSTKCCAKLSLNAVVLDSLRKQPYISYSQAKALIAFRDQHGKLSSWTEVSEIKTIPDSVIQKLKPYFEF